MLPGPKRRPATVMSPGIVGLVLLAALLHVAWNVILKRAGDPLGTAALAMVAAALVSVPIGLVVVGANEAARLAPETSPAVVGLAMVSGLVEAMYLVFLSAAYRRGALSVVYPTARGTAPLVASVAGLAILGERLAPTGFLGLGLLVGGLLVLVRPWRIVGRLGSGRNGHWWDDPAILALATGVAIATYTSLDRVAVRLIDPWLYGALVWPAMAVWTVLAERIVRARAGRRRPAADEDSAPGDGIGRAVVAGVFSYAAYGLVLLALSVAPLTAVAPLRESAVVLASGWGALRMREAASGGAAGIRIAAAAAIVAGAVLLAVE